LVNAKGELVKTLPMFTAAVMQTEVDILDETTYYVRFGDWFAWAMTIATLVLILLQVKRSWLKK
jgi:apolipoprotein N-acyltransferase